LGQFVRFFFAGLGQFLACISLQTGFNQQIPCCGQTVVSITDTEKRPMAKAAAPKKPLTKSELLANVAAATELSKKQVAAVLEALVAEIKKSLGNKGAGVIAIPGLVKIEKKKIPARKAQTGVPNPFKPGELMDRAAKPAYNKVKVRALKLLKDMAK
jgi:nucleoid DNA-binding protein